METLPRLRDAGVIAGEAGHAGRRPGAVFGIARGMPAAEATELLIRHR